jgi:hypothetical protein
MDYSIIVYILLLIIPLCATIGIKSAYSKYKKKENEKGISGAEVARTILDKNGLNNLYVIETGGDLTDCYDPTRKTIKLSHDVFHGTSIAAMAIAAHECGHAIQDKEGYGWMKFRSSLFPIVNISNKAAYILLIIGIVLESANFVYAAVAITGIGLLFQLVTLPVEYDASARAKKELDSLDLVNKKEAAGVKKILDKAALTYVAGVLTTVLQMMYYLGVFRRRD